MTFQQLQDAIALLTADPRTHPNTPVGFDGKVDLPDGDVAEISFNPVAVHIETVNRRIVFTDRATQLDVSR